MKNTFLLLIFGANLSFAQDLPYARSVVETLASPLLWGRGYTDDGMKKAADFIVKEISQTRATPLDGKNFHQHFTMPVNTFPGKMQVTLNGKALIPGVDFIVSAKSQGVSTSGKLVKSNETQYKDLSQSVAFSIEDKLTWSVAAKADATTTIKLAKSRLESVPENYSITIENREETNFKASNVAAVIKGTANPDEYIVMSAHYDHLGGMGTDTYFPGANDNASGTAVLLDLMRYYSAHPQPYSMVFIFFAAEEAGLVGSKYFVENPMIDLKKIRFLMNIDLMGNGDNGATIVNGSVFTKHFALLQELNAKQKFLPQILPRGKAANSDHYWFSENGVPAFFMYTMGGPPHYHDVMDRAEDLPFSRYENVFKLLVQFNSALMK